MEGKKEEVKRGRPTLRSVMFTEKEMRDFITDTERRNVIAERFRERLKLPVQLSCIDEKGEPSLPAEEEPAAPAPKPAAKAKAKKGGEVSPELAKRYPELSPRERARYECLTPGGMKKNLRAAGYADDYGHYDYEVLASDTGIDLRLVVSYVNEPAGRIYYARYALDKFLRDKAKDARAEKKRGVA